MRLLLASLCAASFLAAGCAGPLAAIRDPQGRAEVKIPYTGPVGATVPLKACVGGPNAATAEYFRHALSGVFTDITLSAPDCDLLVTGNDIASPYLRSFVVQELAGGNELFTAFMNFGSRGIRPPVERAVAEAVKARLAPDTALFKSIRRRAGTVPAAGTTASQGLSTTDIERIARALKGAAPAADPAPKSDAPSLVPAFRSIERPDDLAVIVGIESYSDIATKAPYAERDADAVKAHLRALGVPERNIVLLKGAKAVKSSIDKYVGTWLSQMAKPDSRVYFYFSGHGAPDVKSGKAYLVPWDGDPNFLEDTAVPLERLYAKLAALPSKRVLVAMDSCFSGAGGRSVLASGARPLVSKVETGTAPARLTVLSASGASEISGSLDDKRHGAFTYFLLSGLNAGKTTPKALVEYLTPQVQDEARRVNRSQTPQLQGDGDWPLR